MTGIFRVTKKEIKELLTLKNVIPVIALAILFGFIGQAGVALDEPDELPVVSVIDEDNSDFSINFVDQFENRANIVYHSNNWEDNHLALRKLQDNDGTALIRITRSFENSILENERGRIEILWKKEGMGLGESIPTAEVNALLEGASNDLTRWLVEEDFGVSSEIVLNPISTEETTFVRNQEFAGVPPSQIDQALSLYNSLVPIVIMLILIMSGGQVIESMGMEKGNKTLETLLTLPVKRSHIAIGKILGSAVVGLVLAGIYMVGFGYFQMTFQPEALDMAAMGLELGLLDYVLLALSLILTIIAGLAICMLLGAFSKDYKSSQMRIFPLIILVFIPFFLTMFASFPVLPLIVQLVLFASPFTHPMIAVEALLFNDYLLVVSGIVYVGIFSIITMWLVSRIFNSDALITGSVHMNGFKKILKVFNL